MDPPQIIRKATRDTSLWQRDGAMTPRLRLTMSSLKSIGMVLVAAAIIMLIPNNAPVPNNNMLGIWFCC